MFGYFGGAKIEQCFRLIAAAINTQLAHSIDGGVSRSSASTLLHIDRRSRARGTVWSLARDSQWSTSRARLCWRSVRARPGTHLLCALQSGLSAREALRGLPDWPSGRVQAQSERSVRSVSRPCVLSTSTWCPTSRRKRTTGTTSTARAWPHSPTRPRKRRERSPLETRLLYDVDVKFFDGVYVPDDQCIVLLPHKADSSITTIETFIGVNRTRIE